MPERVVYEFPAEFPFDLQLRRRDPEGGVTGSRPPYRVVRLGLYRAEIDLADLERADLEELANALAEELART